MIPVIVKYNDEKEEITTWLAHKDEKVENDDDVFYFYENYDEIALLTQPCNKEDFRIVRFLHEFGRETYHKLGDLYSMQTSYANGFGGKNIYQTAPESFSEFYSKLGLDYAYACALAWQSICDQSDAR